LIPNKHDWYSEMHWMIARIDPSNPDALVLAAKGGHNGEMHNQNDVGSFIVHLNGEPVIADVGRGCYTRFYFSDTRYEHFVCQSLGHSCPVPNGQMQGPLAAPKRMPGNQIAKVSQEMRGRDYYATLLDHRAETMLDLLKIDMAHAYPKEADLRSLVRTIALHRDEPHGRVELVDEADFASGPGTLESVLMTFGNAEVGDEAVLLKGEHGMLRVGFDSSVVKPRIELVENVDLATGPQDVRRVVFSLLQPQQGVIRLRIVPV
jgi:hypothetical protein